MNRTIRVVTRAAVTLAALMFAAAAPPAFAGEIVMYGSDVVRDVLQIIDREDGGFETIGPTGDDTLSGLAYDPDADIIYGISASTDRIFTVNRATGLATPIGAPGAIGFPNSNALAWDSLDRRLYAADLNTNTLFTVNVTTGQSTTIGVISGAQAIEGLAYDAETDTLFGVDDVANRIVILDQETAAATPLPNVLPRTGNWRGLAFDPETRMLFATLVIGSELYRVDPVTGAGAFVGPTGGPNSAVQGLTITGLGQSCDPCDANCDGAIDAFDIEPFITLLLGGGSPCAPCSGDINGDGAVDAFDIEPFVNCLAP